MIFVSVPYEITLLSNIANIHIDIALVSVPYEITLLSNPLVNFSLFLGVSVPYEITLLSNSSPAGISCSGFQYLMKLHYSQTVQRTILDMIKFQYLMKLHYSQTFSSR